MGTRPCVLLLDWDREKDGHAVSKGNWHVEKEEEEEEALHVLLSEYGMGRGSLLITCFLSYTKCDGCRRRVQGAES